LVVERKDYFTEYTEVGRKDRILYGVVSSQEVKMKPTRDIVLGVLYLVITPMSKPGKLFGGANQYKRFCKKAWSS
jgi:hypothetical protein